MGCEGHSQLLQTTCRRWPELSIFNELHTLVQKDTGDIVVLNFIGFFTFAMNSCCDFQLVLEVHLNLT